MWLVGGSVGRLCPITSVRNSNLGLYFFPFKCCVSQLSVDGFGKIFEGVTTLGQVKSSPNFCSFGLQRAEKRNIWRRKNTNLNLNSGLCPSLSWSLFDRWISSWFGWVRQRVCEQLIPPSRFLCPGHIMQLKPRERFACT